MIRPVLPSIPLMPIWRQVESRLKEHLWEQNSIADGQYESVLDWAHITSPKIAAVGGPKREVFLCPLVSCGFGARYLAIGLTSTSPLMTFVPHADLVWRSPALRVFELHLGHQGSGAAWVTKVAATRSSLHYLQLDFRCCWWGTTPRTPRTP